MGVRVSVRRCCRFSGLYAFHSSDSAAVGIPRRMIAVLMSYQAPASSTGASLQWIGRWVCRIRSKSASRMTLEDGVRRGVGPRLLILVGMTAGVGVFRSTHSLGARLNTASDYPLHHSRCSKLTNSTIESFLSLRTRDSHSYGTSLYCKACITVCKFFSSYNYSYNYIL